MAGAYQKSGEPMTAQAALMRMVEQFQDNELAMAQAETKLEDMQLFAKQRDGSEENRAGQNAYEKGEFITAPKNYRQALETCPHNINSALHAAEVLIESIRRGDSPQLGHTRCQSSRACHCMK